MERLQVYTIPARDDTTDFNDLYDEISRDWQQRAEALQARRWRKLKREIKGETQ